ncbi:hypothetical protein BH11PSE13_BH11PSE13_36750 [soil metagenome]
MDEQWHLPDGTPVCIRAIRADDLSMHADFVHGLSFQTGYSRLLSPRMPQDEELRRMTDVDSRRELALVTTTSVEGRDQEMGVARYIRGATPETADIAEFAEFAIVIADAWQRRGLAMHLLERLIDAARQAGVKQLSDITLYDNRGMLALARKLGFKATREAGDSNVTRLRLALFTQ